MDEEPPYQITVTRLSGTGAAWDNRLRDVVAHVLQQHDVTTATINVAMVDDARIAELNQEHLEHPGPTDVITFDLRDGDPDAGVEGEVVLSVETATREASRRGLPLEHEVALYVVHGTLHLLGYDDHEPQEASRMHAREDALLTALGLGAVYSTEPT